MKRRPSRRIVNHVVVVLTITMAVVLDGYLGFVFAQASPAVTTGELRRVQSLMRNWKFVQDDALTNEAALASTGADWPTVSLPHTWNAEDAAGLQVSKPYKRGSGWYRLEFPTPTGTRHW